MSPNKYEIYNRYLKLRLDAEEKVENASAALEETAARVAEESRAVARAEESVKILADAKGGVVAPFKIAKIAGKEAEVAYITPETAAKEVENRKKTLEVAMAAKIAEVENVKTAKDEATKAKVAAGDLLKENGQKARQSRAILVWSFVANLIALGLLFLFGNPILPEWGGWTCISVVFVLHALLITLPENASDANKGKDLGTLYLPEGTIRGFSAIVLSTAVLFYIFNSWAGNPVPNIPPHLFLIFLVVLSYYGLKPNDILPKKYVIPIPEDFGKVSRIPPLDSGLKQLSSRLEDLEHYLTGVKAKITSFANAVGKQAEDIRLEINNELNDLANIAQKYRVSVTGIWEKVGVIMLLIVVALICGFAIQYDPSAGNIGYVLGPIAGIISIITGIDTSDFLQNRLKGEINGIFLNFEEKVGEIKVKLESSVQAAITVIKTLRESIMQFRQRSLLDYMSKHLVGGLSVGIMTFFSLVIFLWPAGDFNAFSLVMLEVVVGFYFVTKK